MKYFGQVLFSTLLFLLAPEAAMAACAALANTTLGAAQAGQIQMTTAASSTTYNKLMYCDGSTWKEFPGSKTAFICAKNGEIYESAGELFYCNNLFAWRFDSTGGTNGGCTKTGEIQWNTGTSRIEFCNGVNWRTVDIADTVPDTFDFTDTVNEDVDDATASIVPITGFSGGILTATFDFSGGCPSGSVRVCANASCNIISSRNNSGTLNVPNGSWIRAAFSTPPTGSSTCSIAVDIGGVSSTFSATTAASDTTPIFSAPFNDSTSQPTSTVVYSNIIKISGHTGVNVSIGDEGLGGSPEFQICNDATCTSVDVPWGNTPAAITNPQWVQLRMTTGAALSYRMANLIVGTDGGKYWNVSTATCPMNATLTPGASLNCTCPIGTILSGNNAGNITGTTNYRLNGRLCRSAVHAGAVNNATGGAITVIGTTAGSPSGTCATFAGSTANGTTSQAGTTGSSMYFSGFGTDTCN